ncbi:hypothetical protein J2X06_001120 [Lysobacter niastensis]|uniref:Uncharacterized protein n=1 Tax=Lysobacter niastensis TaxID=380629 RepID=A0ABU1W8R4_9GAMM|nr:hypothetical protein [Lysobacter niastensis]MDR7133936.1 hypothetical protein [Lysobacter niastensis]
MRPTLGLTGMDPVTESALQAAFADANAQVGGHWQLLPDAVADYVVVDMDSMYGPMSWLRLHGAGKTVIGLTSASRVQTEYRLGKPFGGNELRALLQQLDSGTPEVRVSTPAVVETPEPMPVVEATTSAEAASVEEATAPTSTPSATVESLAVAPSANLATPAVEPAAQSPVAAAQAPAPSAPAARTLVDWLIAGTLADRVRLERDSQVLLIDTTRRQYHGPALLKPLAGILQTTLGEESFVAVDSTDWDRQVAALGTAQPLSRLLWFGALLADRGRLASGFDAAARYQLLKWPQTEREFPKHFRVATAMMKGPATLPEIAEASGVTLEEATDFVNANLATGFAEPFREPEPETDPPKPSGLFGRLRGR